MVSLRRIAIVGIVAIFSTHAVRAGTLEDVQARGQVKRGVSLGVPGFSLKRPDGRWTGLDVHTCRAVAAATLGDAAKVAYSALSAKERFTALQSGEVDLLARNTTWTLARDAALELNFAGVTFYDGQGFLVRRELGLETAVSGAMGRQLGLSDNWACQIIKQVGNYAEVYERNVGPDTPLGLERGLNALWTDGGLLYAMPFR